MTKKIYSENSRKRINESVKFTERFQNREQLAEERFPQNTDYIYGKITGAGASTGLYTVDEVAWDGTTFSTFTGGRTWDSSNLGEAREINGIAGVETGTIVDLLFAADTSGGDDFAWLFTIETFKILNDSADETAGYSEDKFKAPLDKGNDPSDFKRTVATDPPNNQALIRYTDTATLPADHKYHYDWDMEELSTATPADTDIMIFKTPNGNHFYAALSTTKQDLWETISSDSGSTTADSPTDTLTVTGSGGISTAIAGDTLTITSTNAPDQDLWETINSDSGSTTANTTTDTLGILGGEGITTSITADNLTIKMDINSLPAGTLDPINDFLAFWDVTATASNEKQSLDGMLKTISGYNASNDQVLVNDAGVLKWVDLETFVCP